MEARVGIGLSPESVGKIAGFQNLLARKARGKGGEKVAGVREMGRNGTDETDGAIERI